MNRIQARYNNTHVIMHVVDNPKLSDQILDYIDIQAWQFWK